MHNDKIEKTFNIAGPVNRPNVYKVDPLTRWDMQEVLNLIKTEKYFLLHAPRQTGKTSCLKALADYLNSQGRYYAVCTSFESGASAGDDFEKAIENCIKTLLTDIKNTFKDNFDKEKALAYFRQCGLSNGIFDIFQYLSQTFDKPLVLFLDEIDSLVGNSLLMVLRQMRAGYPSRPENFPQSILLCGLRDIRDFRIQVADDHIPSGYSPFNIISKSLRLGNFTRDDVVNLYQQHTAETGQRFDDGVVDLVMEYTDGQPWLVNAIANEVTYEMNENRDRTVCITKDTIAIAKERIILARRTHLENLIEKLKESRVRRVILPMLTGEIRQLETDDVSYCIDLGLIKKVNGGLFMANNIYQEVIPRELAEQSQGFFPDEIPTLWRNDDGTVNVNNLLTIFHDYWYENMGVWTSEMSGYKEAAAQIITLTFLQRIINGGGDIHREYAAGRKRMDIYVKRFYYKGKSKKLHIQKIVLEVKTISDNHNYDTIRQKALEQTSAYAKIVGVKEAEILIFNRGEKERWSAIDPVELTEYDGVRLQIWKL